MPVYWMKPLAMTAFGALVLTVASGCAHCGVGAPKGASDVIAHRGASAYAPENTIAAFELAKKMKADWFELDCMLSKDGEVVVMHDSTVDRTTNGAGFVSNMTVEELKALDAGAWLHESFEGEHVPTLREALAVAKRKIGCYVEVKDDDPNDGALVNRIVELSDGVAPGDPAFLQAVMAEIEASGTRNLTLARKVIETVEQERMNRRVVIQSFSPVICAVVRAEAPQLRCEYLGSDDPDNPSQWENYLKVGYALDVDGFNIHRKSLTRERLDAFHANGKTCAVWTVNDIADMRRLVAWGVDGIISDKPQWALSADKYKHRDPFTYHE